MTDARAGETCFDAMEEYGAEGAYCSRNDGNAVCDVAILKVDETRQYNEPGEVPDRRTYYGVPERVMRKVRHNWENENQPYFAPYYDGQTYYLFDR